MTVSAFSPPATCCSLQTCLPAFFQCSHASCLADIYDLANSVRQRQRVVASAITYFRRFYAASSFSAADPRIIAPGCLYLASKVEESVVMAKALQQTAKRLKPGWAFDVKALLDAEMVGV